MKLSEKLKGVSLFTELWKLTPIPALVNYGTLDALLVNEYGDRTMFYKMVDTPIEDIAQMLMEVYGSRWLMLQDISEIDLEVGAGTVRKLKEKVDNREDRNTNYKGVNKVSGFNSDELVTDTGNDHDTTDGFIGDLDRDLTESIVSAENAYNRLSLADKHNIIKQVLKNVADLLTISIY